jgi:hypothetical protein
MLNKLETLILLRHVRKTMPNLPPRKFDDARNSEGLALLKALRDAGSTEMAALRPDPNSESSMTGIAILDAMVAKTQLAHDKLNEALGFYSEVTSMVDRAIHALEPHPTGRAVFEDDVQADPLDSE